MVTRPLSPSTIRRWMGTLPPSRWHLRQRLILMSEFLDLTYLLKNFKPPRKTGKRICQEHGQEMRKVPLRRDRGTRSSLKRVYRQTRIPWRTPSWSWRPLQRRGRTQTTVPGPTRSRRSSQGQPRPSSLPPHRKRSSWRQSWPHPNRMREWQIRRDSRPPKPSSQRRRSLVVVDSRFIHKCHNI